MALVSIVTPFLLICFTVVSTGNAGIVRRDVPQIGTKNETKEESYPNPPVPTPPGFSLKILFNKNKEKDDKPEDKQHDPVVHASPTKWGFNDKYLASQNKYAVKRNALFDVVGGDAMSFSNFRILGNSDVGKK